MDIEKEITALTREWYNFISSDHHKDKDCHWYIKTVWSYGQNPNYFVEHRGYILDDISIECKTYNEALTKLAECLKSAIDKEKEMKILYGP